MATRTLHPAFGYVVARNQYVKGDLMFVDATVEKRSHIFYVKGNFTWTDNATDVKVIDCSAGDFIPSDAGPVGVFKGEALSDDSIFFCFDPKINKNTLPDLTPVRIDSQSQFSAGTKLYLCEGKVVVKDKEINAPAQIKLASGTVVSCVGSPAHCLIFP